MNLPKSIKFNQKALQSLERVQVFKYRNSKNQEIWLPMQELAIQARYNRWRRQRGLI